MEMEMNSLEFNESFVWVCFVTNLGWIYKFSHQSTPNLGKTADNKAAFHTVAENG